MHPTLLVDIQTPCQEFINALNLCHEHRWNTYLGKCNQIKLNLNSCLFEEHEKKRKANAIAAKEQQIKAKKAYEAFENSIKDL